MNGTDVIVQGFRINVLSFSKFTMVMPAKHPDNALPALSPRLDLKTARWQARNRVLQLALKLLRNKVLHTLPARHVQRSLRFDMVLDGCLD